MGWSHRRAFSVSAYARFEGKVLLVKHKTLGAWLPIGGEFNYGETPATALRRKIDEETGWHPHQYKLPKAEFGSMNVPEGFIAYEEHDAGQKGTHMNFAFVLDAISDQFKLCSQHEEARWISKLEELGEGAVVPGNVQSLFERVLGLPLPIENDAQSVLARLGAHFNQPVMPLSQFCDAITLWVRAIEKLNASPVEPRSGRKQGNSYHQHLGHIIGDIRKSNLLGRLLYGGENFRTKECPEHKGQWTGIECAESPCPHGCQLTGWIRES